MVNGFSLWDSTFPLVWEHVVVVDPYLEDMGSLSPWINRTLIFLHASGYACSKCLPAAGWASREWAKNYTKCPCPTGPGGRIGQGKGHEMTGAPQVLVTENDRRQVEDDDTQPRDGGISGHHMFVCLLPMAVWKIQVFGSIFTF